MAARGFPTPHDWKEGRRLRAWAGGVEALRRHPAPGARPKLPPEQWAQLPALLARGPAAFGFRGDLWTAPRIAAVIEAHFGVRYHPAHLNRRLRASRWSPQRPIRRATQRDEAAIARWYAERWPTLKKGPPPTGAPSSG